MKHNWSRDENGNIDTFAWSSGYHNGVFCEDCGKTVCIFCNKNYLELDDCTGKPKVIPITNGSHIRNMNDKELATWIKGVIINPPQRFQGNILSWLQEEVE